MQKPAETAYLVHDLIRDRWSPRAYSAESVEPEKLGSLLEAARWAASCFNEQPWRFLVATKDQPEEYERLLNCLVEGNISWAKAAPVLMISVAKKTFTRNGRDNRHGVHDVGLAVGNLSAQATAMGLAVHQMAGFLVDKTREEYGIPDDFEPVAAIAIGYPGKAEDLPEALQEKENAPRSRKPLAEIAFTGGWDVPSSVIK